MLINRQHYRTIWVHQDNLSCQKSVDIIDQTQLPHTFKVVNIRSLEGMISAVKTMQVRGAPLIGAAAAYGIALCVQENAGNLAMHHAAEALTQSRPTAVNLQWAVKRMLALLLQAPLSERNELAWLEAAKICDEDVAMNQAIGQRGLDIIEKVYKQKLLFNPSKTGKAIINILTHCNAGWLATVDGGTALAPIYAAHEAGLNVHVWVDETRPRNQGASLTAWELGQHGVPYTVITDNAGGHFMQHEQVDMVIVGADRVTATGDVCNKIGTYLKALAAFDNQVNGQRIPFYAAVPSPTIDWMISNGLDEIEIEMRHADELGLIRGCLASGDVAEVNILPTNTQVANPAFDVTPARLVTGILTEYGLYAPNALATLKTLLDSQER
jgi:methylthioribose-1-phosphate isomerase